MGILSVMGLYLYDNTIFDDDNLPIPDFENTPVFERSVFVDTLLFECAELGLVYPHLDIFKRQLKTWAKKNAEKWVKLYRASIAEFDPIENYDRREDTTINRDNTETHSGSITETHSGNLTETHSGGTTSTTVATTLNTGHDAVAHYVKPMNETDAQEVSRDTTTLGSGNTTNGSVTNDDTTVITTTDTRAVSNTDTRKIVDNGRDVTTSRVHGNIGVTTAPQMLAEYREYASHIVIDDVVNDFKHDFCILIY